MIVITKSGKPIYACLTEEDAVKYLDNLEGEEVEANELKSDGLKVTITRYNSLWLDVCPHEYKCYIVPSNIGCMNGERQVVHDY